MHQANTFKWSVVASWSVWYQVLQPILQVCAVVWYHTPLEISKQDCAELQGQAFLAATVIGDSSMQAGLPRDNA